MGYRVAQGTDAPSRRNSRSECDADEYGVAFTASRPFTGDACGLEESALRRVFATQAGCARPEVG